MIGSGEIISDKSSVLDAIRGLLRTNGIEFRELHHQPTFTSEESAAARGEELRTGGKALLVKVDQEFRMFVLSAACKLDSGAIKSRFQARKTRFASPEELAESTGLVPGSIPPFGRPILPFDLFVDTSIAESQRIAFNAGSLTDSIILSTVDYLRIASAEIFRFSL